MNPAVCLECQLVYLVFHVISFSPSVPGEDVWSYAKKLPHLFQQGGVFYNIVKKDMGTFVVTWFTASTSSEVTGVTVSVIISSLHTDGESGEVLLSTKHF